MATARSSPTVGVVIPTLGTPKRCDALHDQCKRLSDQLGRLDSLVVVVDSADPDVRGRVSYIVESFGYLCFPIVISRGPRRKRPNVGLARNAGVVLTCSDVIVELDDHDLIEMTAIERIRSLVHDYDYVFGACHVAGDAAGTIDPGYIPGAFARNECEPIGVRAIRRTLWDDLGGWDHRLTRGGCLDFAKRAEAAGAKIVCTATPLCTITLDIDDSMMAKRVGAY